MDIIMWREGGGDFVKPKKGGRVIVLENIWSKSFKTEKQFGDKSLSFAGRNLQEDVPIELAS
jgi:hypothetical protein